MFREIGIWAPPNLDPVQIAESVNTWMQHNPDIPPFERFLQRHVSSEWPVFWHMTSEYKLELDAEARMIRAPARSIRASFIQTDRGEICPICHNELRSGTETLLCRHTFHTMCIHRWWRTSATCPICRSPCT